MDSRQWYKRHTKDTFVNMARADGFRSRAAYKLLDLHKRLDIFQGVGSVIDLGAAPGSWTQVASRLCSGDCRIIAVDCLAMTPLAGVEIIKGDIREQSIRDQIDEFLCGSRVDLILSDMAPNLSGINSVDQTAASILIKTAIDCCQQWLDSSGVLVIKSFHGEEFQEIMRIMRERFVKVKIIKPVASRPSSNEVFLYAKCLASC